MDQQKRLTFTFIGIVFGLGAIGTFIPLWSTIFLVFALAIGVYVLDRCYLAKSRKRRKQTADDELLKKLECGTSELHFGDDGLVTIKFHNISAQNLSLRPSVTLQYSHVNGVPTSGAPMKREISLSSRAARPVRIDVGASHCFELLNVRSRSVPLEREEHLRHSELLPFLRQCDGIFALLIAHPDIYSLKCTFYQAGLEVTRFSKIDGLTVTASTVTERDACES